MLCWNEASERPWFCFCGVQPETVAVEAPRLSLGTIGVISSWQIFQCPVAPQLKISFKAACRRGGDQSLFPWILQSRLMVMGIDFIIRKCGCSIPRLLKGVLVNTTCAGVSAPQDGLLVVPEKGEIHSWLYCCVCFFWQLHLCTQ